MKKYVSLLILVLLFCAAVSVGCGGGGNDSADSEQTESLSEDTGDDTTYDIPDGGRGGTYLPIDVHIDRPEWWSGKTMAFYAQRSDGTWVRLMYWSEYKESDTDGKPDGDKNFTVYNSYVAFGFEVDVDVGTQYPYSGVFWEENKDLAKTGEPSKINIDLKGTSFNVSVKISVNDTLVVEEYNCSSKVPYGWNDITVTCYRTIAYFYNATAFYGRKSSSSPWVKLITPGEIMKDGLVYLSPDVKQRTHKDSSGSGTTEDYYTIPRSYVEFGFEFDITGGTYWPYSNVFWTAEQSASTPVDTIKCVTGGTVRTASVTIYVNGKEVVNQTNCSSHTRYDWSNGPGLSAPTKLNVLQRGAFATSDMNFYGRKAGGKWEKLYSFGNSGDEKTVPDGYVDFGFEFNIGGALDDGDVWPYSWPFWIAEEHPDCNVKSISITVGGWWWFFGSPHIDITVMGYDANGEYCNLYSYSNHELDYKDKSPNKGKQYSW